MEQNLITDIKCYVTNPDGRNFVIVKVETEKESGLGCATFQQMPLVVKQMIDSYLKPFVIGMDANDIENIWQTLKVKAYWRNGPVSNNAIAGIDMALWDIKAKLAGVPLYMLFGGKCRNYVHAYTHNNGDTMEEVLESIHNRISDGFQYIRCQIGGTGGTHQCIKDGEGIYHGNYLDSKAYIQETVDLFREIRLEFGDKIELMHDVHERIDPNDALLLMKKLEPYSLYFLEDPISPENIGWLKHIRANTSVPIGLGELFNNTAEYLQLITDRDIDFLRLHVSQIGGITPALKIAGMAELFGVHVVWHTPIDLSPIGIAVNTHLNMKCICAAIQEYEFLGENSARVFPGAIQAVEGKIYPPTANGIGVGFDEAEAKKYPNIFRTHEWTQQRRPDGRIHTP